MSIAMHIISNRVAYDDVSGIPIQLAPTDKQLNVHSVAVINGGAVLMQMGIAHNINPLRFTNAGTVFYASAGGTVTPLTSGVAYTTTNNDGMYVVGDVRFGMIGFNVDTASTGTPVFEYSYWNGATWVVFTPQIDSGYAASGRSAMVFSPSYKWVKGNGGVVGVPAGFYTIRVRATTAPGTAVSISGGMIYRVLSLRYVEGLQSLEMSFEKNQLLLGQGEGIVPIFETPNALHTVEYTYRNSP